MSRYAASLIVLSICLPIAASGAEPGADEAAVLVVAQSHVDALCAGDVEAARRGLASVGVRPEEGIDSVLKPVAEGRFTKSKARATSALVEGDVAAVVIDWTYNDVPARQVRYLVRQEQRWRIIPTEIPGMLGVLLEGPLRQ